MDPIAHAHTPKSKRIHTARRMNALLRAAATAGEKGLCHRKSYHIIIKSIHVWCAISRAYATYNRIYRIQSVVNVELAHIEGKKTSRSRSWLLFIITISFNMILILVSLAQQSFSLSLSYLMESGMRVLFFTHSRMHWDNTIIVWLWSPCRASAQRLTDRMRYIQSMQSRSRPN